MIHYVMISRPYFCFGGVLDAGNTRADLSVGSQIREEIAKFGILQYIYISVRQIANFGCRGPFCNKK